MIVGKKNLIGENGELFYGQQNILVTQSSEIGHKYQVLGSRRLEYKNAPDLYMLNNTAQHVLMMYNGESQLGGSNTETLNSNNGGMDVYIRKYGKGILYKKASKLH